MYLSALATAPLQDALVTFKVYSFTYCMSSQGKPLRSEHSSLMLPLIMPCESQCNSDPK